MRIVVLGASGQIGSLIRQHLKSSHEVVGTSRTGTFRFDPFGDDWKELGKADVLINCIGQIRETPESSFHQIHVNMTRMIIAHRAELGNPRIIQVSALGASTSHPVEFLRTKGIADELLLQHPDTAVIRPSIVCTPGTIIVKKLLMLANASRLLFGVLPVPKGFLQSRIQPIMADDLAELVQKVCVKRDIRLIEAVGPEEMAFGEMTQILFRSRRLKSFILEVPRDVAEWGVRNLISRFWPHIFNEQQYQLLFEDNIGKVGPCTELLGRPPSTTRNFFESQFSLNALTQGSGQTKYGYH